MSAGQGTNCNKDGVHGTTATINDIPQGTGESQRIGRKCTVTSVHCRLTFRLEDLFSATSNLNVAYNMSDNLRFMIVLDRQCNGAGAGGTEILAVDTYDGFMNLSNKGRFRILYDKIWAMNGRATSAGTGTTNDCQGFGDQRIIKINKRCFIPIEFDGATGGLSEIKSNNIGIVIWSNVGVIWFLESSECRIRFIDY